MKLKRLIGIAASIATVIGISSAAHAYGTGEVYYITYDDYFMVNTSDAKNTAVSPYETNEAGGSVSVSSSTGQTLTDISEVAPVECYREFERIDDKTTWELGFYAVAAPDGTYLALRQGSTDIVKIQQDNLSMYLLQPNGKRIYLPSEGGYYYIKSELDIKNGTMTLQLNGKTMGSYPFLQKADYLDGFYVTTDKEGTGSIQLRVMRLSVGYSLNEAFLTTKTVIPDDWKLIGTGQRLMVQNNGLPNDHTLLVLEDGDFSSETGVSHPIKYDSDELWFEFEFFLPEKVKEFGATLSSSGQSIIKIGSKNDVYGYWGQDGKFVELYNLRENLWYHGMVKLTADGAKVYINHKLLADNVPYDHKKIDNIKIATGKTATGTVYCDDFIAHEILPLPEDYCPAPVKPAKTGEAYKDKLVGMQSCNIWREGTHFGWDSIRPYNERTPILGYFDEGSAEAKDWETKWFVEHGVDFEIYCWYRQPNSTSMPIKRPRNSFALNDGFFNGQYSDQMKFIISWENGGGTSGMEDFKKNLVPYWIEQYYKDPRYLVIDNKPVMGIYLLYKIRNELGGDDAVKEAFDYLDAECKKEGFDGVYIVVTEGSASQTTLESAKYVGIDALYVYTWGASSYNIDYQKTRMESQLNLGLVPVMPTISHGFEQSPWERAHADAWLSTGDMKTLMEWARDDFMKRSWGLGSKIMTLDNWNEFGEGHFFYPTNLEGFGYLDSIRSVFTDNPDHTDVFPTEAQKARVNHLYIQNKYREKTISVRQWEANRGQTEDVDSMAVLKACEFDENESIESYPLCKQIDNLRLEDGAIKGTSNNVDPGFFINDINLSTKNVRRIKVRFKADAKMAKFQIYYITDSNENWKEAQSAYQDVATDGEYKEFILDPTGDPTWDGKLTSIRIDPMAGAGNFEIDYIRLLGDDTTVLLAGYQFDENESIESYPLCKQIDNLRLEDGCIKGTASAGDPGFFINNINLSTKAIKSIKVRYKDKSKTPKFQIYYITDTYPDWKEAQSVIASTVSNGEWVTTELNPSTGATWNGILKDVRVDPMAETGDFEIDYIEIYGTDASDDVGTPLYIDGDPVYPKRDCVFVDDKLYVCADDVAGLLEYKYDRSVDDTYIELVNSDKNIDLKLPFGQGAIKVGAEENNHDCAFKGDDYFALRKVAEASGYKVVWDAEKNAVNVIVNEVTGPAVVYPADPKGHYNFHENGNMEGLTGFGNMADTKVKNDVFSFNATSTDPMLRLPYGIQADEIGYCHVRVKNKTPGTSFKIYFTTPSDTAWNETKAAYITIKPQSNDWQEGTISLRSNVLWKGQISQIRIDPVDGAGPCQIDYMIFDNNPINQYSVGDGSAGASNGGGVNILTGGNMDDKVLKYDTKGLNTSYTAEEGYVGRYSLKVKANSEADYIKIPVSLEYGTNYNVSLWAKTKDVSSIKIGTYDHDGAFSDPIEVMTKPGEGWANLVVELPERTTGEFGIYLIPGAGTVYIDGLRVNEETVTSSMSGEEDYGFVEVTERTKPRTGATKVLILGNSITQHAMAESIGWLGNWGMAATSEDKDYVHILKKYAEGKDKSVIVKWKNISEFEKNFYNFNLFANANYNDLADFDADIIITMFGANIKTPESDPTKIFNEDYYYRIIDFFSRHGDATIIAGTTPLTGGNIKAPIKAAAEAKGWAYVDTSDLTAEEYTAKPYKDNPIFTADVTAGVLNHPGDKGMQAIADKLWPELQKAMDTVKRK